MQHDINALRKDVDATQNNIIALNQDKLNISDYTALDILSKLLTVDGSGSGLDTDKLDGMEYSDILALINAKLNSSSYTAQDVLNKLLGVDGSGSGLDADKLDGFHIGMGNATISSVTANTIGTINITISAQPSMYRVWAFTHGGTHGTIQLNGVNGSTFTFQYKFEATTTNRSINYIYFY